MKKFKALKNHACRFNDDDNICECFVEGYKARTSMGVSEWRNLGRVCGYWSYFEEQIRQDILEKVEKWNKSGYYSDCLGKHGWSELINTIK